MLSRVARQRSAIRSICHQQSRDTLPSQHLPFLYPALRRWQSNSPKGLLSSSTNSSHTTSTASPRYPAPQTARHLATAIDPFNGSLSQDSYVPWQQDASSSPQAHDLSEASRRHINDFSKDVSSLIVLEDPFGLSNPSGKAGLCLDSADAQNRVLLETCIRVGQFERAKSLLKSMAKSIIHDPVELLQLHNSLLAGASKDLILKRDQSGLFPLQKWFEVEIKANGCTADEVSYALMIKLSLRLLHGPRRDRTVRRYWDLARLADLHEDVLQAPAPDNVGHVLSDQELGELSEICPTDLRQPQFDDGMTETVDTSPRSLSDTMINEKGDFDVAEVRATQQQGLGLSSLRESLAVFHDKTLPTRPTNIKSDEIQKLEAYIRMRQVRLEQDAVKSATARWKQEHDQRLAQGIEPGQSMTLAGHCHKFQETLSKKIREQKDLAAALALRDPISLTIEEKEILEMSPYLQLLPAETLAYTVISCVLSMIQRSRAQTGIKVATLVVNVGRSVANHVTEDAVLEEFYQSEKAAGRTVKEAHLSRRALVKGMMQDKQLRRSYITKAVKRGGLHVDIPDWPASTCAKVGACLTKHLVDTAKMECFRSGDVDGGQIRYFEPVFRHRYKYSKGKKVGVIVLNEELSKIVSSAPPGHALAKHLPMLAPPRSWTGIKDGAFYSYRVPVLRYKDSDLEQRRYCEAAAEKGDLEHVFAALDVLGRTPWKINDQVLKVMIEVWNTGEKFADLAPATTGVAEPEKPEDYRDNRLSRAKYFAALREAQNKHSSLHSQRCFQNFQLEVARSYRNEIFYLPHSIDFRGRAYPLPPYLNQMGADNSRGLLLFGKGRPLGTSGLRWLRIHLANVFGFDKASLSEREQFSKDHMEDITDSATKPLEGKRWWLQAEDPWQCLATCFELHAALTSPDPHGFVSHLPVHQDGSCNGLQHYAALGGDSRGAAQVNLVPSDRPSDVYTAVAEIVKQSIARDAAAGHELATFLEGRITRKVVKQTVMTNVYGVTFLGATRQVRRQLVDLLPDEIKENPNFRLLQSCAYVAKNIFGALGELFSGAHDIQAWLGCCASRITSSLAPEQVDQISAGTAPQVLRTTETLYDPTEVFKSTIIWTTPLKLPVVQPYKKLSSKRVKTSLQSGVYVQRQSGNDPVDQRKQLQAFPPNFIHSLDACHMALSAIACDSKGLSFSAVHDSFWTHASDIDEMNHVLRDAFIRMHSENIIGRLAAEFEARYSKHLYLATIKCGNPVADAIDAWRAAHHGPKVVVKDMRSSELILERKRQKLLDSDDPAERAEGAKMVTPASIYAASAKDDSILYDSTLSLQKPVAHIPPNSVIKKELKWIEKEDGIDLEAFDVDTVEDLMIDSISDEAEESAVMSKAETSEVEDDSLEAEDITSGAVPSKGKRQWTKRPSHQWYVKSHRVKASYLWLPMTFPPVPKRGDFEVSETKNSKYFFS